MKEIEQHTIELNKKIELSDKELTDAGVMFEEFLLIFNSSNNPMDQLLLKDRNEIIEEDEYIDNKTLTKNYNRVRKFSLESEKIYIFQKMVKEMTTRSNLTNNTANNIAYQKLVEEYFEKLDIYITEMKREYEIKKKEVKVKKLNKEKEKTERENRKAVRELEKEKREIIEELKRDKQEKKLELEKERQKKKLELGLERQEKKLELELEKEKERQEKKLEIESKKRKKIDDKRLKKECIQKKQKQKMKKENISS